jgi:hypothetical protein
MSSEQMLLAAVATLAGCVSVLFLWAKGQFAECQAREKICADKYERILLHLANIVNVNDK